MNAYKGVIGKLEDAAAALLAMGVQKSRPGPLMSPSGRAFEALTLIREAIYWLMPTAKEK